MSPFHLFLYSVTLVPLWTRSITRPETANQISKQYFQFHLSICLPIFLTKRRKEKKWCLPLLLRYSLVYLWTQMRAKSCFHGQSEFLLIQMTTLSRFTFSVSRSISFLTVSTIFWICLNLALACSTCLWQLFCSTFVKNQLARRGRNMD